MVREQDRVAELEAELERLRARNRELEAAASDEGRSAAAELLTAVRDVLWTLDLSTMTFSYLSPAFYRMLGYDGVPAERLSLDTFTPRSELARLRGILDEELAREGRPGVDPDRARTVETVHRRADGRRVPVEVTASLVRDADGRPFALAGVTRDIGERKRASEALEAMEQRFRLAAKATTDLIYVVNVEDGTVEWPEGFDESLGYAPGQIPRTVAAWVELVHPDDRAKLGESDERHRLSTRPLDYAYRMRACDGSYRRWEDRGLPVLGDDGHPVRWVGACVDVTERHALEEQLHRAQKMEAVGRLAGGIAHDFNNILCAITGNADLVLSDHPLDPDTREALSEILDAARRASDLTKQLLAFSRKQVIAPRVLDLGTLGDELRPMLERLLPEDILLETIAEGDRGNVRADAAQMEQVIVNLAINARDSMPSGGRLVIEIGSVELDEEYCRSHPNVDPGAYVRLAVSDTGVGMDTGVRGRVFEPFFTTKEPGRGTGLGLATVFGIVKQHGGAIEVYSERGRGSVFKVYLPRVDAVATPAEGAASGGIRNGTETVLLVEDEAFVRRLAARVLERAGYVVLEAGGGREALKLLAGHPDPVALLLTDVVMPHMNGRELAEEVERRRPGIKVLFTSGYTRNVIAHHGVLEKGVHFLPKPYSPEALTAKIRDVLDGPVS